MGKKAKLHIHIPAKTNVLKDVMEMDSGRSVYRIDTALHMLKEYFSFEGTYVWDESNWVYSKKGIKERDIDFEGRIVLPRNWDILEDLYENKISLIDIVDSKQGDPKKSIRGKMERIPSWPSFWPDSFRLHHIKLKGKPQAYDLKPEYSTHVARVVAD